MQANITDEAGATAEPPARGPRVHERGGGSLRVVVVGAGMSGILTGIKLLEAGFTDFEILEMGSAVGGTWRDNTYPGLTCDVPAHSYDYSFEPNWKWKGLYATGPEIREYFERCAERYGVLRHVRFDTVVRRIARESGEWVVTSADGVVRRADVVINCMGVLVHPKLPAIVGLESFAGASFHSARWDHAVKLEGRRVGVIGSGSTATQLTTELAGRAGSFTMFQRTPQWVCPNFEHDRADWVRRLHRRSPAFSAATGHVQAFLFERTFCRAVVGDRRFQRALEWLCQRNLAKVRDPELRARLTPKDRPGCKRMIFSDTFYEAIQRPGAEVVQTPIERVEPRGVVTRDGRLHELDVLVLATGFHALDYARNLTITGEAGEDLGALWANGPRALRSVAVAGFPNLFMLIGPHSPIGNFSLTGIAEIQIRYIMALVGILARRGCARVAPTEVAQRAYNAYLQAGMKNTVWVSGCKSWYLDASGAPAMYPFTPDQFRRDMLAPDLSEFDLGVDGLLPSPGVEVATRHSAEVES